MTGDASRSEQALSVFLSILMVGSVMAIGGAAFAGSAAAQQGDRITLYDDSGSEVGTYSDLDTALSNADTDYTINISAGEYDLTSDIGTEGLTIEGPNAGTSGTSDTRGDEANVTFSAAINADNVTIDGVLYEESSSRVQINGANVTISNTVVEVPDGTAPVRLHADDTVITNNEFDGPGGNWIINSRQDETQLLDGVTITDNVFQNAADGAVQANGWINAEISGNNFTDLDADAVRLAYNVTGTEVTNNVIRNTGQNPDNELTTGIALVNVEGEVEISANEFENNPYHIASYGDSGEVVLENNEFDKRVNVTEVSLGDWYIAGEIQAAVDHAAEDSTVSVGPGTYNESVTIDTANITLTSTDGADVTTINASGPAVSIGSSNVTVEGFSITGDYTLSDGRNSGDPAIKTTADLSNLNVTGNQITNYYAGVQLYSGTVTDATIESNTIENAYLGIGQAGDDGTQIVGNNISAQVQGISGWNVDNMVVEDNTIVVNSSTISEANEGPFVGSERGVDVSGNNVAVSGNAITSINTAVLVQSAAGQDVVVTQNNLLGDEYGIDASGYTHTLNATNNWWGTESGPAADAVQGDVTTNPYLTVPSEQAADSPENLTEFGFTVEMDAGAHAFGVPGPVEGTVGSIFNDFNGTVYAYTDGSWEQVTNTDHELAALDALLVIPEEGETARASIEIAEGSGGAVPSSKSLDEGWNFVGAPQDGSIESAYGAASADPARALNFYDVPTVGGDSPENAWTKHTFGTDATGNVSSVSGYWVYAEQDGSVAANVPAGVTYEAFEDLTASEYQTVK